MAKLVNIVFTERTILKKCRTKEEASERAQRVKLNSNDPRIVEIAFYPRRQAHSKEKVGYTGPEDNSQGTYEVSLISVGELQEAGWDD